MVEITQRPHVVLLDDGETVHFQFDLDGEGNVLTCNVKNRMVYGELLLREKERSNDPTLVEWLAQVYAGTLKGDR